MVDAVDCQYPDFDEAEARFLAFLRSQGFGTSLLYVCGDDLILANGRWFARGVDPNRSRREAKRAYDTVVQRGFGVLLSGRCVLNGAVCVYVSGPRDEDEAERLMSPNGLKLSLTTDLPVAVAVGPARWVLLRARQRFTPRERAWKTDLLK